MEPHPSCASRVSDRLFFLDLIGVENTIRDFLENQTGWHRFATFVTRNEGAYQLRARRALRRQR
jgi:hypothetical protein